jgi:hypothetical protein
LVRLASQRQSGECASLGLIGAGAAPANGRYEQIRDHRGTCLHGVARRRAIGDANGQAQSSTQSGATESAQAPITGVFCIEEMTATFCNVVTGPNTGGYGARSGSGSTGSTGSTGGSTSGLSTGPGGGTSSIPSCPAEPPFKELCN